MTVVVFYSRLSGVPDILMQMQHKVTRKAEQQK